MRVGFVQNRPAFLNKAVNLRETIELMEHETAKGRQADLWVLPEFFATGYHFRNMADVRAAAEESNGTTFAALRSFCERFDCAVVAGFPERSGKHFYNSAMMVTPAAMHLYRKVHLFGREKLFFEPGNLGFNSYLFKGARIGMMICFDWFFPESMRTLALQGAEVIAHPANLVLPWCPEAMKIRCLENRVFAVTADRVGRERDLNFIGQSQVVGPRGQVLIRAGVKPQIAVAKIDPRLSRDKRISERNDLFEDRRPETYFKNRPAPPILRHQRSVDMVRG